MKEKRNPLAAVDHVPERVRTLQKPVDPNEAVADMRIAEADHAAAL